MEILGNGFHWQKWMALLLLTCAVLAYRTLGNTDLDFTTFIVYVYTYGRLNLRSLYVH